MAVAGVSANRLELLTIADAVAREKNIDKEIVVEAIEEAIQKGAKSRYGAHHDIRAKICQQHPAERPRSETDELDDAHPGERAPAHASPIPTVGIVPARAITKTPSASAVVPSSSDTVPSTCSVRPPVRVTCA